MSARQERGALPAARVSEERPIVLVDVDGCLTDGKGKKHHAMIDLVRALDDLGYEPVAWSSAGADHALEEVEACHLDVRCLSKPVRWRRAQHGQLAQLVSGRVALAIDDNDPGLPPDVPVLLVDGWWG